MGLGLVLQWSIKLGLDLCNVPSKLRGRVDSLEPRAQARHQDSVTGGAEINFGGARAVFFCEFERGTGAREIYPSLDQVNKVRSKDSKGFSGRKQVISKKKKKKRPSLKLQGIFRPKSQIQAVFPASPKKSSSSQKRQETRCQSTKNTNLGLDLHFSSPDLVNFFGAQSSLGGAQFSFGGARPRYAPPWRRVCPSSTLVLPRTAEVLVIASLSY